MRGELAPPGWTLFQGNGIDAEALQAVDRLAVEQAGGGGAQRPENERQVAAGDARQIQRAWVNRKCYGIGMSGDFFFLFASAESRCRGGGVICAATD